jgi:hypothetical protein
VSAAAVRTLPNTRRRSGWRELKTNSLKWRLAPQALSRHTDQELYSPLGSQGAAVLKAAVAPHNCIRIFDFWYFCGKTNFIMRFLRIRPVQKVVDNPTQLSGRGFPRISHVRSFSSQLYLFCYSKIEAEPRYSKSRKVDIWNSEKWSFFLIL